MISDPNFPERKKVERAYLDFLFTHEKAASDLCGNAKRLMQLAFLEGYRTAGGDLPEGYRLFDTEVSCQFLTLR